MKNRNSTAANASNIIKPSTNIACPRGPVITPLAPHRQKVADDEPGTQQGAAQTPHLVRGPVEQRQREGQQREEDHQEAFTNEEPKHPEFGRRPGVAPPTRKATTTLENAARVIATLASVSRLCSFMLSAIPIPNGSLWVMRSPGGTRNSPADQTPLAS